MGYVIGTLVVFPFPLEVTGGSYETSQADGYTRKLQFPYPPEVTGVSN